jgi:hypothetical protein
MQQNIRSWAAVDDTHTSNPGVTSAFRGVTHQLSLCAIYRSSFSALRNGVITGRSAAWALEPGKVLWRCSCFPIHISLLLVCVHLAVPLHFALRLFCAYTICSASGWARSHLGLQSKEGRQIGVLISVFSWWEGSLTRLSSGFKISAVEPGAFSVLVAGNFALFYLRKWNQNHLILVSNIRPYWCEV